jgi:hypothetical protein
MRKFCFVILVVYLPLMSTANNDIYRIGGRSAAMVNASVSMSDVWSTHHNQAGLAFMRRIALGATYENRFLIKELSIKSAAAAIPIKYGTIGLSIRNFGYSLYRENKYNLSFAKAFGDKFAAAIAFNYLTTKIAEGYGNSTSFVGEIGLQAKPFTDLTIGAHLYNPTRTMLSKRLADRIPTIIRLGANYNLSKKVILAVETEKDLSKKTVFKAGVEYAVVKEFYLRMGIASNPALSSFGFSIHLKNFNLDLAANYHQVLGITPQLSLVYQFTEKTRLNVE